MSSIKQIIFASLAISALLATAAAQESTSPVAERSTLTITATAAGDRVRITAPASVVQMHLEVYAAGGDKVFDQEIRGGNVFDWHLQDGQARRLAPGSYVCVVTAKNISGQLSQKIGTVRVAESTASVQPATSLSAPQAQTIGPLEENSSWTIPGDDQPQTTTVIAHDGNDGQMIRGRGALTFRIGNFFNGIDQEQMRLSEAGDLGIGTSEPKAKLDVAGTIRAERFVVAKPKASGPDKIDSLAAADSSEDSVQPLVSGTGTAGRLTKWTDGSGTLADSLVTETGSNIGIGTTTPQQQLHVMGTTPTQFRISKTAGTLGLDLGYDDGGSTNASIYNRYTGLPTAAIKLGFGAPGSGEVMTLLQSGSVGLGTTSPQTQFQIMGPSVAQLRISKTAASLGMDLGYDDAGATNAYIYNRYTGLPSAAIKFGFGGSTGSGVAMTLLQSGNVGIGTTTPAKKLDVAGDINTNNDYNIGGSRVLSIAGTNNLFAGLNAGPANTSGSQDTFVGRGAGFSNTTGSDNSFFGYQAGNSNTSGGHNSFFGSQAGLQNTGGDNAFFGHQAGMNQTASGLNAFFGAFAGRDNTIGSGNSFFGYGVAFHNTQGGSNSFFGTASGFANTMGEGNSFFGYQAGQSNIIGGKNTMIGENANVGADNLNFATAIGAESVISTSNSIGLGRSDGSDTVYVWGLLRTGLDGTGSLDVCRNADLRLSTCSSSLRYKTRVQPFTRGLDVVRQLRPITFEWKDGVGSDVGFGAEDVEQVEPLLTTRNDRGEIEGVKYKQLTTVLVNAIKEQQDQIAALRTANNALNARLRQIERTLRKKRSSAGQRR